MTDSTPVPFSFPAAMFIPNANLVYKPDGPWDQPGSTIRPPGPHLPTHPLVYPFPSDFDFEKTQQLAYSVSWKCCDKNEGEIPGRIFGVSGFGPGDSNGIHD